MKALKLAGVSVTVIALIAIESLRDMQTRVAVELFEHLNGGPYFGGLDQPSLADFAIFPQLVFNYMVGIEQELKVSQEPTLKQWMENIQANLPGNPLLVGDFMIVNHLPPVTLKKHSQLKFASA